MKVRLDLWLQRNFDPPPHIRTARHWIKTGRIYPIPIKVGRAYYVEESAEYIDHQYGQRRPRLAERVFGKERKA